MALTTEQQALFDHAKQSLPRWLTEGVKAKLEWLNAFAISMDSARVEGYSGLASTYLNTSTGAQLDQHGADRAIYRRIGELDDTYRERIRQVVDAVTEPALKAAIDAILAASLLGTCAFVALRRDRAHCQLPTKSTSFLSRGYRMTVAQLPMQYIVILPFGTTAEIAAGVEDYLRKFGPAGYGFIVEIRGVS